MRRTILAAAVAAILPAAAHVSVAVGKVHPLRQELGKYSRLYYAVREAHGARAPGRNIRRYGVRVGRRVRAATPREIAASIRQLRLLRTPLLTPGFPRRPPAGVMTARPSAVLTAIASCESGGDPRAVSPTGAYRGKYQFDLGTWREVGGSGDPAAAPESEQDMRAAMLYRRAGPGRWPVCGR